MSSFVDKTTQKKTKYIPRKIYLLFHSPVEAKAVLQRVLYKMIICLSLKISYMLREWVKKGF